MDINNEQCAGLWLSYCLNYNADVSLEFPEFDNVYAVTLLERQRAIISSLICTASFQDVWENYGGRAVRDSEAGYGKAYK